MNKNIFLLSLLCVVTLISGCKKKKAEASTQHTASYWNDPAHQDELKKAMDACNAKFGSNPREGDECAVITESFSKQSWKKSLSNEQTSSNQSITQSLTKGDNVW